MCCFLPNSGLIFKVLDQQIKVGEEAVGLNNGGGLGAQRKASSVRGLWWKQVATPRKSFVWVTHKIKDSKLVQCKSNWQETVDTLLYWPLKPTRYGEDTLSGYYGMCTLKSICRTKGMVSSKKSSNRHLQQQVWASIYFSSFYTHFIVCFSLILFSLHLYLFRFLCDVSESPHSPKCADYLLPPLQVWWCHVKITLVCGLCGHPINIYRPWATPTMCLATPHTRFFLLVQNHLLFV